MPHADAPFVLTLHAPGTRHLAAAPTIPPIVENAGNQSWHPDFLHPISPSNQKDAAGVSRDMGTRKNGATAENTVTGQSFSADPQHAHGDFGGSGPLGSASAGWLHKRSPGVGRAAASGAGDGGPRAETARQATVAALTRAIPRLPLIHRDSADNSHEPVPHSGGRAAEAECVDPDPLEPWCARNDLWRSERGI
jgi:hypothetical protein